MHTFLHTKFQFNIQNSIPKASNILIALSSGQDSLCLLKLAHDCLLNKSYNIKSIYIDHQWKKDSLFHLKHLINLTKTKRIPLAIYQIKKLALSESIARENRYKILIQHAIKENCTAIITGHNNNDKVETFFNNIIRGSSLNGINGLTLNKKLNKRISIVRPLINFSKSEITWFCRLFYLPIWSDITNYNFYIQRNRLRHEILPYLQNYFNPQVQKNITNFINFCCIDNEYIQENTLKLYFKSINKNVISLNLKKICNQHTVLQKRVIRLFFYYHFQKQINKNYIKKILHMCNIQKNTVIYFEKLSIYYVNNSIYIKK
uniref:tRNA(Ile)-lysidine synthase n=1 Tax=Porolithon onkodes TaxID=231751 RepID=A0A2Z2KVL6_9FLOR|nr:tRNA(Ile)-lysidine synthase [Porolithon onkodes]ASB29807.1 tRNA(Ile)-lysidine synthase [Porolithon onkodes]